MARRHRNKQKGASSTATISANSELGHQNGAATPGAASAPKNAASSSTNLRHPTSAAQVLGYVNFDGKSGEGNVSTCLIDSEYLARFRRGRYVRVQNYHDARVYLGRVVAGPFFSPDYVSLDSAIARVAIQKAATISMLPDYHAYADVEVLGEIQPDGNLLGMNTRPLPKSPVESVDGGELIELLNIDGDLVLGRLDGYDDVPVRMRSDSKKSLPRNLGIFGTVGSGKTNTSQVLIEEASKAGWSVVVLDIEGEYVEMDRPTEELLQRLQSVGKAPKGIDDFHVVYPVCAPPDEPTSGSRPFSVGFGGLPAAMIAEIVGMNDAQQERFFQLYDACVRELAFGVPRGSASVKQSKRRQSKTRQRAVGPIDDENADSPNSDNRSIEDELTELELLDEAGEGVNVTLRQLLLKLLSWLKNRHDDFGQELQHAGSWNKVRQQLRGIQRLGLFDMSCPPLSVEQLLVPGRVSVINLSDSSDPRVNNIVIAEVLRLVFNFKRINQEPRTLIVIEEAHTFVSKENISRMEATMDKLREIARRGRKRWLGLAFISQQPSHLPSELYELCNTLFVHETNGRRNVEALRSTAGTVNDGIWHDVPVLGQGRCVIVSPQYKHPVVAQIDPCQSKRKMVD